MHFETRSGRICTKFGHSKITGSLGQLERVYGGRGGETGQDHSQPHQGKGGKTDAAQLETFVRYISHQHCSLYRVSHIAKLSRMLAPTSVLRSGTP